MKKTVLMLISIVFLFGIVSAEITPGCFDPDDPNKEMQNNQSRYPPARETYGFNIFEKSTVTSILTDGRTREGTDWCPSNIILTERYCGYDDFAGEYRIQATSRDCQYGCVDGACLRSPHTEIPEFTTLGAIVVLIAIGLLFMFRK